jgi:hypothetical protein
LSSFSVQEDEKENEKETEKETKRRTLNDAIASPRLKKPCGRGLARGVERARRGNKIRSQ